MKNHVSLKFCTLCLSFFLSAPVISFAQTTSPNSVGDATPSKSAQHRVSSNKITRNAPLDNFLNKYSEFKNYLDTNYGFDYAVDVSYMPQYGAPNGKKTAFQTLFAPSVTWTNFDNQYGTGIFNFSFNATRYAGSNGEKIGNNIGVATDINDYSTSANSIDELYYSYQLPDHMNWLTVALGQFPLYNFDGTTYASNQQVNFINYALSQNASSSYPTASLGGFMQIAPKNSDWGFSFGAQDATNIDGDGIVFTHLDDEHYATFAEISYSPVVKNLGSGQYSAIFYNMPATFKQPQTTNGWSLNLNQNIGEKLALFAKVNGVTGDQETIRQSYALGMVYNNPLNRNPLDQIGIAAAYNKISEEAVGENLSSSAEKILEAYWAWGISKWMTLTPDVQFYFDPALNTKSDYATVFSLRASLFF